MGYVDRSRTEFGSWEGYQNSSVVRLNVSGSDFFLHDQCQYGVYIYIIILYIYHGYFVAYSQELFFMIYQAISQQDVRDVSYTMDQHGIQVRFHSMLHVLAFA